MCWAPMAHSCSVLASWIMSHRTGLKALFSSQSIGVSPDGRGIQGDYSLTAFLVEPDE